MTIAITVTHTCDSVKPANIQAAGRFLIVGNVDDEGIITWEVVGPHRQVLIPDITQCPHCEEELPEEFDKRWLGPPTM